MDTPKGESPSIQIAESGSISSGKSLPHVTEMTSRVRESIQKSENSYYKCPVCPFKSLKLEKRQNHIQKHTLKEIYESGWTEFYPLMTGLPENLRVLRDWSEE